MRRPLERIQAECDPVRNHVSPDEASVKRAIVDDYMSH